MRHASVLEVDAHVLLPVTSDRIVEPHEGVAMVDLAVVMCEDCGIVNLCIS